MWECHKTSQRCCRRSYFQCSRRVLTRHVCAPGVVAVPPLAHGVLQCPVNGVMVCSQAFCFYKDQTDDNLVVRGQDCRVGVATLFVRNLWLSLLWALLHASWPCYGVATLQTFLLWDKLDEGEHSQFLVFPYRTRIFEHTTRDQQMHSYCTFLYLQYSRCEPERHVSIPCWNHHQGLFLNLKLHITN